MKLTLALENYLLAILVMTRTKPVAQIKDMAASLNVASASVTPAMRRLEALGLIEYRRREHIKLSEQGMRTAKTVQKQRERVSLFLEQALKMTRKEAERESDAISHYLMADTHLRVRAFLDRKTTFDTEGIEQWDYPLLSTGFNYRQRNSLS